MFFILLFILTITILIFNILSNIDKRCTNNLIIIKIPPNYLLPSTQPSTLSSIQSITIPSTQPSTQSITIPPTQPYTQPSTQPYTQPSTQPSTQSATIKSSFNTLQIKGTNGVPLGGTLTDTTDPLAIIPP